MMKIINFLDETVIVANEVILSNLSVHFLPTTEMRVLDQLAEGKLYLFMDCDVEDLCKYIGLERAFAGKAKQAMSAPIPIQGELEELPELHYLSN